MKKISESLKQTIENQQWRIEKAKELKKLGVKLSYLEIEEGVKEFLFENEEET